MDNLFGIGEAVERDSWVVAQVEHGIAPQMIGEALLAVDRDGAKSIVPRKAKDCRTWPHRFGLHSPASH